MVKVNEELFEFRRVAEEGLLLREECLERYRKARDPIQRAFALEHLALLSASFVNKAHVTRDGWTEDTREVHAAIGVAMRAVGILMNAYEDKNGSFYLDEDGRVCRSEVQV